MYGYVWKDVCKSACMCVYAHVCVRACVCVYKVQQKSS